jgi:sporulation protein YlmC with PRC-barrel domain
MRWQHSFAALCGSAVVAAGAIAADPQTPAARETRPNDVRTTDANATAVENEGGKILAARTFRTSKLAGLNVRNMQGEELGEIDDFVVDLTTGKIQYAAMSVGGVLGIGDKLLAVPFDKLKFDHGQDEMFFVLNMSKDKIAAAPGFDQNDWPDFADPNWTRRIDQHYRQTEVRTGDTAEPQNQRSSEPRELD